MDFEWDETKNDSNIAKHGIDFNRARTIFEGFVLERVDRRDDYGEQRVVAIGVAIDIEMTIVYTMRGEVCRIISVRKASRDERRNYRQAKAGRFGGE